MIVLALLLGVVAWLVNGCATELPEFRGYSSSSPKIEDYYPKKTNDAAKPK